MDIFCNKLQQKLFKVKLVISELLITHVTNREKATVMQHMGAVHSNNSQMILKLLRYDMFCNNLQQKK